MSTVSDEREQDVPQSAQTSHQGKCITVIFNPVSGQGDPEERKKRIEEGLSQHGYTCQHLVTTKEKGARYWTEQALKDGVDLLAVSGGDGTVVEAMSALIGTGVPLAIFPAGTGNLLSVNLNLPRDVPQSVHAALFGERRRLDLARITPLDPPGEPTHFAILAGAGYDATVIRDADRETKNRLGLGAYLLSAFKNLRHRPVLVRIRLDGAKHRLRRRAKSVMVANMGMLQGNVPVVPDAQPDDGYLDVAILKAETLGNWLRLIVSILTRRLREDPSIEYHRARQVEVELSSPQPMQYDGEEAGEPRRVFRVEVVPGAVEVMVSRTAPR
ncbi:MAG: diacylglycerol kinase family lipid kinase [Cytophagales bacterium]|nr:diacylglycerol kinase family lipid kinase [Armatimonadota bacterium]